MCHSRIKILSKNNLSHLADDSSSYEIRCLPIEVCICATDASLKRLVTISIKSGSTFPRPPKKLPLRLALKVSSKSFAGHDMRFAHNTPRKVGLRSGRTTPDMPITFVTSFGPLGVVLLLGMTASAQRTLEETKSPLSNESERHIFNYGDHDRTCIRWSDKCRTGNRRHQRRYCLLQHRNCLSAGGGGRMFRAVAKRR